MDSAGRNVGSLLRLFKSGFFDTWLCISYLYKHFNQQGIVDYLCNELYRLAVEKPEDIDMYATQLCVLVVHQAANSKEQTSLERFLLDQCSKSIRFAIKACWIFQGFVQDRIEAAVRLREFCEIACVNCKRPSFPSSRIKGRSNSLPSLFKDLKVETSDAVDDISKSVGNSPKTHNSHTGATTPSSPTATPIPTTPTTPIPTTPTTPTTPITPITPITSSTIPSTTTSLPTTPISSTPTKDGASPPKVLNGRSPLGHYMTNSESSLPEIDKLPEDDGVDYDNEFWQMELTKKDRCDYFNSILAFVEQLGQIAQRVVRLPMELRQAALVDEITFLNKRMPDGLYLPLWHDSRYCYHSIIRVPPEDSKVLNSRERVPFMINLELLQSTEDVTSKSIHKIVSSFVDIVQSVKQSQPNGLRAATPPVPSMEAQQPSPLVLSPSIPVPALPPIVPTLDLPLSPILSTSPTNSTQIATSTTPPPETTTPHNLASPRHRSASYSHPLRAATAHPTLSPTPPPPTISSQWYPVSMPSSISMVPSPPVSSPTSANSPFGVLWKDRVNRIRGSSPFGHLPNCSVEWLFLMKVAMSSVIMKYGDDLRQEQLASQLLMTFKRVWDDAKLPLWLNTYEILVTSANSGIIETVADAISLHNIKKNTPNFTTLLYFFVDLFGEVSTENFKSAQRNFVESLAAYSIVCYILQIKDRHNGNILLDSEGHIIHIDFGFMLSNSPGNMYFESAPFKLTQEFVDVMGGVESRLFQYFKALCIRGFLEIRKHMDRIVTLVEMMMTYGPALPSFVMGPTCISDLTSRFSMALTEKECVAFVEGLIAESLDHFKTRAYDKYQSFVTFALKRVERYQTQSSIEIRGDTVPYGFFLPNISLSIVDDGHTTETVAKLFGKPDTSPEVIAGAQAYTQFMHSLIKDFDVNKDGKVSKEELLQGVEKHFVGKTPDTLPAWWREHTANALVQADTNKNGVLSLEELTAYIRNINPAASEADLKHAHDWAVKLSGSGKFDGHTFARVIFEWATNPNPTPEASLLLPYFSKH